MGKSFKDLLLETPQAIIDDWGGFKVSTTRISKRVIDKFWTVLEEATDQGKPYLIIQSKENPNLYNLGAMGHENEREVFIIITSLKILPRTHLKSLIKNPIQMSEVETMSGFKGQGFATLLYKWFLNKDYTIISDNTQYNGARKLYDRLSKNHNIKADLFDDESKQFLKKDIDVDSGEEDWDFDSKLWSINADKSHLLICLRKV